MKPKRNYDYLKPHQFKKGVSGNPKGVPPNPIKKAIKDLTVASLRHIIVVTLSGNIEELQTIERNPNSTVLEVGLCRAILKAIARGDWNTIELIISRIVGKIPDKLELTGADGGPQVIVTLPGKDE